MWLVVLVQSVDGVVVMRKRLANLPTLPTFVLGGRKQAIPSLYPLFPITLLERIEG
jgi:hypothetical protein